MLNYYFTFLSKQRLLPILFKKRNERVIHITYTILKPWHPPLCTKQATYQSGNTLKDATPGELTALSICSFTPLNLEQN